VQAVLDASANPILICDGGELGQWAKGFLSAPRTIINGPSGAIGGAIPYAIGARLADPDALVVAMSGDGSAGFHIAEFDTAIRADAPFVVVIGNDARWHAEQLIQLRDYGPDRLIGTDLLPTRYDRVAEGFGAWGASVATASELPRALGEAARAGRAACVNVRLAGLPAPVFRRPST
jgi:acetolactate synthase I/II/III large subunit